MRKRLDMGVFFIYDRRTFLEGNVRKEEKKSFVQVLTEAEAICQDGHVHLPGGRHSNGGIDLSKVPNQQLVEALFARAKNVDVLIIPKPFGEIGVGIGWRFTGVTVLYAEKPEGKVLMPTKVVSSDPDPTFTLKGKRCLVIDDVLRTGRTVKRIIDDLQGRGGTCEGLLVIAECGQVTEEELGTKIDALISIEAEAWDADACPMCQEDRAVERTLKHHHFAVA